MASHPLHESGSGTSRRFVESMVTESLG